MLLLALDCQGNVVVVLLKWLISTGVRSVFVLRDRDPHVGNPFGFTPAHGRMGCIVLAHQERFP